MPRRRETAITAAAALLFVALCALRLGVWDGTAEISDLPVYERYGQAMEDGEVPYRDFGLEYPPLALPAFALPALASGGELGFARAFGALMVVCGLAALLLTARSLRLLGAGPARLALGLALLALSPLLLGDLLLTRFDLWPAALVAGATTAFLAGRDRLGAGVLGLAAAAKLYPLVLLPLAVAWTWRRRGRRDALVSLGIAAAATAVPYLVFAALDPGGVLHSIGRQLSRPLQIESTGASVLLALHHAAGMSLDWASSHGSQNLTGTGAAVAAALATAAQVAVLAWVWARHALEPVHPERLVRWAAAALVAFVVLGKVLSPQFLVWLLAPVALVAGGRGLAAGALLAAACLLTRGWFPGRYWELVKEFDPAASWLLLARDLALLALLAVLALPLTRARAPAGSPSPAPSAGRS